MKLVISPINTKKRVSIFETAVPREKKVQLNTKKISPNDKATGKLPTKKELNKPLRAQRSSNEKLQEELDDLLSDDDSEDISCEFPKLHRPKKDMRSLLETPMPIKQAQVKQLESELDDLCDSIEIENTNKINGKRRKLVKKSTKQQPAKTPMREVNTQLAILESEIDDLLS